VGGGNARVQVAADINFDRIERTTELLDPDRQVIAAEQRAEIVPGAEGGAGSTNTSATYENSRSLEMFSAAPGTVKRISVAVLVNERTGTGADAAYVPRTPEELTRIESLVRTAVGIDDTRGDMVSVVSVPFDAGERAAPEAAPLDVMGLVHTFHRPAISLVALLLAFFIALKVIRSLQPQGAPALVPALAAGPTDAGVAGIDGEGAGGGRHAAGDAGRRAAAARARALAQVQLPQLNNPLREQVAGSIEERPELAARLMRAWMREA
jgi:flagellar M-ring protein FliF